MENEKLEEMSVEDAIKQVDAGLVGLYKFIVERHKEFEEKFQVLVNVHGTDMVTVDPNRVLRVAASYTVLYDWYLTEYSIAKSRLTALEEARENWYIPRKAQAEALMKANKEHVTLTTIQQKVSSMWPTEYREWERVMQEASINKELLDKRLDIIHDSRYALQATTSLRDMWISARFNEQTMGEITGVSRNYDLDQAERDLNNQVNK